MVYSVNMIILNPDAGPKERILTTATRLFFQQGYTNTGINQIIKEANVAKASFYDHFGSKDTLALAYLENLSGRWITKLNNAALTQQHPFEKVIALFDFLADWAIETDFVGCPFLNLLGEFPLDDIQIRETVRTQKETERRVIRNLVQNALPNDIDGTTYELLADTVFMLFEGAFVQCRVYRDVWPIHQAKNSVGKLLN